MITEKNIESFFDKQILNIKINHLNDKNFCEYDYIVEVEKILSTKRNIINFLILKIFNKSLQDIVNKKVYNEISKTIYNSLVYKELKRITKSKSFRLYDLSLIDSKSNHDLFKYIIKNNYISRKEYDVIYQKIYNHDCSLSDDDKKEKHIQEHLLYRFDYAFE